MIRSLIILALLCPAVAHADLKQDIAARAEAALPSNLALAQVELAPSLAALPSADAVSISWRGAPRVGRVTVVVTATNTDGTTATGWARLRLLKRRAVVVAARAIKAGQRIGPGDLKVAQRAVERGQGWQMDIVALDDAEVLRDVSTDAIIGSTHVAEPTPVPRGAEITVVITHGSVTVSTAAVLERSARPGELTSARLLTTRRVVRGRLLNASTLRLGAKQ